MATKTALVGQLQMDGKAARAEIDAVNKKIADLLRNQTRITNIKFKGPDPKQLPTSAVSQLGKAVSSLVNVNGKLVSSSASAGKGLDQTKSAGQRAGAGILELSRAFEDAQYGMRGVLNNIPGIIQSFGGGAGLAGVVSLLAVSLTVAMPLFSKFTEASENLKKANEEAAASYRQLLKEQTDAAAKAGKKSGEFASGTTAREDAGRKNYELMIGREERLIELQDQLRMAEATRLEGTKRLRAELEITSAAEMREAKRKLETAERMMALDNEAYAPAKKELDDAKAEAAELESKMKRREREWLLLKQAEERENQRLKTDTYRTHEYAGDYQPIPRDAARAAYLNAEIPGLQDRVNALEQRGGENYNLVTDARQRVEKELPAAKQAKLLEIKIQEEKDAVVEAVDMVSDMMGEFAEAAEEAGEAAGRIIEQKEKRRKNVGDAFGALVDLMSVVDRAWFDLDIRIQKVIKAEQQRQRRAAELRALANKEERDLSISEIRNPRVRKRAQRAAAIQDRTDALMKQFPEMSREEAAGRAAREEDVKDRESGDRTIKGAGPARQFEGLSYDFRQTRDRPIPEKKTDTEKRGKQALDKAKDALDKSGVGGGGGGFGELIAKFNELIQVTREQKAPGESGKPLRSN